MNAYKLYRKWMRWASRKYRLAQTCGLSIAADHYKKLAIYFRDASHRELNGGCQ